MLKYIKNYRFRSIFLKNMCMVVMLLLLPFLIALMLLKGAYDRVLEAEQDKYMEEVSAQMVSNVNDILQETYSKMTLLQGNEDVKLFAYTDENRTHNAFYSLDDITQMMQLMVVTSDCLQEIYLYAQKSGDIIYRKGMITAGKQELFEGIMEGQNWGIYLSGPVDDRTSKIYLYYVLNEKKIHQTTIIYEMYPKTFARLVCQENDNPVELVLKGVNVWANKEIPENDTERYLRIEKTLDVEDLILRIYFEKDAHNEGLKGVMRLQYLSVIGLTASVLLIIWLLSVKMYAPVRTIMKALEDYGEEEFSDDERGSLLENKDELEYILNTFYREADKKQYAESELKERIIMMKKSQMVALQAQINPHFIFNTLDAINWMALKHLGKRNEVSVMTGNLAKMIRLFGENANTLITLEEELTYVSIYVKIMEMRCENRFSVKWDIPESLLQHKVVKLMLQPLVENAITHGVLVQKAASVIYIRAYVLDGILYISVKDYGPGMREQELETLKNTMEQEILREDRHFGLSNVNRRLRLMFGEKSGVNIKSGWGCGTEATIAIPVENCVE